MKPDKYGALHDAEQEAIEEDELEAHNAGLCPGAPRCGACLDRDADDLINHVNRELDKEKKSA